MHYMLRTESNVTSNNDTVETNVEGLGRWNVDESRNVS